MEPYDSTMEVGLKEPARFSFKFSAFLGANVQIYGPRKNFSLTLTYNSDNELALIPSFYSNYVVRINQSSMIFEIISVDQSLSGNYTVEVYTPWKIFSATVNLVVYGNMMSIKIVIDSY